MKFKNKTVLITGSSRGIGRATAIAFAQEGANVVVNYVKNKKAGDRVVKEIKKLGQDAIAIKADVSNESDVKKMIQEIKSHFSGIDILVNNAGIFSEYDKHTNTKVFENIYKNNFLSCVLVTKYTLPLMKYGKIINTSSIYGKLGYGNPTTIAYSSFKAALENYTKNLAKELAPNILVNAVAPGRTVTPMWDNPDTEQQKELGQVHLIKRMIQPEEIADAIMFLAKNDAVCGEILTIDGGMSLLTLD